MVAVTDDAPTTASARLDPVAGDWRGVSPKYVVVDLVGNLIAGALMTAAASATLWLLHWGVWGWVITIAVGVVALVLIALTPRRVRAIRYQLREDDLVFRRGLAFQRIVAVPFGRMQLVDITRGPLARALGLAELKLVTAAAATGVVVPGLAIDDAEELRDRLVALAETRRAGL